WRDSRRMIVRFYLDRVLDGFFHIAVFSTLWISEEAPAGAAFNHRGIVAVSGKRELRRCRVRVLDHAEQALFLRLAIDRPARIEYLVPAMLGVGLREHHQFRIARIAPQ